MVVPSLVAVYEAAIRVKSMYVKIVIENNKKRQNMETKVIFT